MKVFMHSARAGRSWGDEIARMRCLVARWICTWGGPSAGAAR
jgi:hypothetical protein